MSAQATEKLALIRIISLGNSVPLTTVGAGRSRLIYNGVKCRVRAGKRFGE